MKPKYKKRSFVCVGCGKQVNERRPKNNQKYCSLNCYRKSKRPLRKNGKVVNCDFCGNKTYKSSHFLKKNKNNFCSVDCSNQYQGRNKITFICKICGKYFKWSPSRIKNNNPMYCSMVCRNKDKETLKRNSINANMIQSKKKGLNKIELSGQDILKKFDFIFKEQILIENKFLVDVYIPKYKLIIQWDGDYWHGYNKKLNEVDKRIKKRMLLDISQDAYMKKCGYNVLRYWEHDIKTQPQKIYEDIQTNIKKWENNELL